MKLVTIKKLFNERRRKLASSISKSSEDKVDFGWNQFSRKNSEQYITLSSFNNVSDQVKTQTLTKKTKDEIFKANLEKSLQEAIILKFDDGNCQILSETDFGYFIEKLRNSPIFKITSRPKKTRIRSSRFNFTYRKNNQINCSIIQEMRLIN
jgi:hypothetical protein